MISYSNKQLGERIKDGFGFEIAETAGGFCFCSGLPTPFASNE